MMRLKWQRRKKYHWHVEDMRFRADVRKTSSGWQGCVVLFVFNYSPNVVTSRTMTVGSGVVTNSRDCRIAVEALITLEGVEI